MEEGLLVGSGSGSSSATTSRNVSRGNMAGNGDVDEEYSTDISGRGRLSIEVESVGGSGGLRKVLGFGPVEGKAASEKVGLLAGLGRASVGRE